MNTSNSVASSAAWEISVFAGTAGGLIVVDDSDHERKHPAGHRTVVRPWTDDEFIAIENLFGGENTVISLRRYVEPSEVVGLVRVEKGSAVWRPKPLATVRGSRLVSLWYPRYLAFVDGTPELLIQPLPASTSAYQGADNPLLSFSVDDRYLVSAWRQESLVTIHDVGGEMPPWAIDVGNTGGFSVASDAEGSVFVSGQDQLWWLRPESREIIWSGRFGQGGTGSLIGDLEWNGDDGTLLVAWMGRRLETVSGILRAAPTSGSVFEFDLKKRAVVAKASFEDWVDAPTTRGRVVVAKDWRMDRILRAPLVSAKVEISEVRPPGTVAWF